MGALMSVWYMLQKWQYNVCYVCVLSLTNFGWELILWCQTCWPNIMLLQTQDNPHLTIYIRYRVCFHFSKGMHMCKFTVVAEVTIN